MSNGWRRFVKLGSSRYNHYRYYHRKRFLRNRAFDTMFVSFVPAEEKPGFWCKEVKQCHCTLIVVTIVIIRLKHASG
jgi:hypothetical protein